MLVRWQQHELKNMCQKNIQAKDLVKLYELDYVITQYSIRLQLPHQTPQSLNHPVMNKVCSLLPFSTQVQFPFMGCLMVTFTQ